jgi:predicted membrane metal-binding protein
MRRFIDWRIFVGAVAVAVLLAWASYAWFGLGFWISLGIVIAAVLLNGIVALVEDQMPGGFDKPRRGALDEQL